MTTTIEDILNAYLRADDALLDALARGEVRDEYHPAAVERVRALSALQDAARRETAIHDALRAQLAQVTAERDALRAEREAFHNGLRTALAKGVGEPDNDIARAARSDAELNEAYERWVAVGMHGLVGLSLYRRNDAGEVEFVRHGTQEEDDAHIITFQTALRAMTRWRDAATSLATTFASWWMTMTALGATGVPEDRRDQLTAEARELTRKMLKLCGENSAEVGE